MRLLAFSVTT